MILLENTLKSVANKFPTFLGVPWVLHSFYLLGRFLPVFTGNYLIFTLFTGIYWEKQGKRSERFVPATLVVYYKFNCKLKSSIGTIGATSVLS